MKPTFILPTILIVIDVGAAVVYLSNKDPRQAIYWIAAATLTACATYK